jgi:hypothetical protein
MFLSGVLFILFLAGCWLYCLTDAVRTPAAEFPGLPKRGWIVIIAVTFILGAIAWQVTRTRRRARRWPHTLASHVALGQYGGTGIDRYPGRPVTPAEALARHPASQARRAAGPVGPVPVGPDDDPEFLRMLDQRIKGTPDSGELHRVLTFPLRKAGLAPQAPRHS